MNTRRYAGPIIGAGQLRVNWVYFSLKPAASSLLKAAPTLKPNCNGIVGSNVARPLTIRHFCPSSFPCLLHYRSPRRTIIIPGVSIYPLYINLFMGVKQQPGGRKKVENVGSLQQRADTCFQRVVKEFLFFSPLSFSFSLLLFLFYNTVVCVYTNERIADSKRQLFSNGRHQAF